MVQRSTRYVLAGNHTLRAALSLGWPEIDVVFVDVDGKRAKKIVLSSNRTAELPDPETGQRYDDQALAELLAALDGDYEGTGVDVHDIDGLRGQARRRATGTPRLMTYPSAGESSWSARPRRSRRACLPSSTGRATPSGR